MQLLIADYGPFVGIASSYLERTGHRCDQGVGQRVCDLLRENLYDYVILDPVGCAGSGNGWIIYKDAFILRSTSEMIIFTTLSRAEFDRLAACAQVSGENASFFCKSDLEVPPVLGFMRRRIQENPHLIRVDVRDHLPSRITKGWIKEQPSVCRWLMAFAARIVARHDYSEDSIEALPDGLRWVYRLAHLEGEVANGGFQQFLANAGDIDALIKTIEAARAFQANEIVNLLERARGIWEEFHQLSDGFNSAKPVRAQLEKQFEELDRAFCELEDSWVSKVDASCKRHPELVVSEPETLNSDGEPDA